jgi:hypothetical protein
MKAVKPQPSIKQRLETSKARLSARDQDRLQRHFSDMEIQNPSVAACDQCGRPTCWLGAREMACPDSNTGPEPKDLIRPFQPKRNQPSLSFFRYLVASIAGHVGVPR